MDPFINRACHYPITGVHNLLAGIAPLVKTIVYRNDILKAEGTNFPQLKRVIVATGDKVVMEPTLDEALTSLFGTGQGQSGPMPGKQAQVQAPMTKATRDQAEAQLAAAQKAINALKQLLANPAQ